MDWYSFTLSFKGVFLEGLEVAFIVLTFGSTHGKAASRSRQPVRRRRSSSSAVVGVLVHAPLSRVPENTMKFAVGVMLTTFGIFWGAEGAGVDWPGKDSGASSRVLAFVLVVSFGLVALLEAAA